MTTSWFRLLVNIVYNVLATLLFSLVFYLVENFNLHNVSGWPRTWGNQAEKNAGAYGSTRNGRYLILVVHSADISLSYVIVGNNFWLLALTTYRLTGKSTKLRTAEGPGRGKKVRLYPIIIVALFSFRNCPGFIWFCIFYILD